MIKAGKYLYIHWLFILLAVFCYINRQLEELCVSYMIITVHELSHLIAAKYIGLSCSHITVYPFGLNLKLKNTIIYSLSDEVILYLAGPLSNILMALFGGFLGFGEGFYLKNIALFLINILPIVPLDGGMIMKKVLNYKLGYERGNRVVSVVCTVFLIAVLLFFAFLIYMQKFNPSFCIFIAFLVGNIMFSKEKYDTNLLKELLYAREKNEENKIKYADVMGADINASKVEIAKKFIPKKKCFVILTDSNNTVCQILTKEEIIEDLLELKIK